MAEYAVLAVVKRKDWNGHTDLLVLRTNIWAEAQYVWKEMTELLALDSGPDAHDFREQVAHFCVRDMDDQRSKLAHHGGGPRYTGEIGRYNDMLKEMQPYARSYGRAYLAKARRTLVRQCVKDETLTTLHKVVQQVLARGEVDGLVHSYSEAERYVKEQIGIGRTTRHKGDRGAWFWPKGTATLSTARTPEGHQLHQTTLALQASFQRLPQEA